MRLLVVSSCTSKKSIALPESLICNDLVPKNFPTLLEKYKNYKIRATDLYKGEQHIRAKKGIKRLRSVLGKKNVDFYIISAGFGIINENELLIPYECSFQRMKKNQIKERAQVLKIEESLRNLLANNRYDLIFYLLGREYLQVIGTAPETSNGLSIFFVKNDLNCNKIVLGANNRIVKKYASFELGTGGIIAFKGGLFKVFADVFSTEKKPKELLNSLIKDSSSLEKYLSPETLAKRLRRGFQTKLR